MRQDGRGGQRLRGARQHVEDDEDDDGSNEEEKSGEEPPLGSAAVDAHPLRGRRVNLRVVLLLHV